MTTEDKKVLTIVLTGGPCGGKTSCLELMRETLKSMNMDVYTVPEVASLLIANGARYPGLSDRRRLLEYESNLIKLQLHMEDTFLAIAKSTGRPSVMICDRGAMDVAAYVTEDVWSETLSLLQTNNDTLLKRYDQVIHLVTAADGAEEFYTHANNVARSETPEEARRLDHRTLQCWVEHNALRVVENRSGEAFKGKMQRAVKFVTDAVIALTAV